MGLDDKITPKRNYLLWGLLLSLIVHVLFLGWKYRQSELAEQREQAEKPIELVEAPASPRPTAPKQKVLPPEKKMEMAETQDAKNREIDPNAKILSEHNQTVQKQTKAKSVDDFRKKEGKGLKNDRPSENAFTPPTGDKSKTSSPAKPTELGDGSVPPSTPTTESKTAGVKRDWKTLSLKDLSMDQADGGATAATDDRLKNVDTGEDTILSTREYRYFSYYHRIKELLRQYWKPNVERQLSKLWTKGRNISDDEMITKLLVLLNPSGQIQKISRVGSSGISELDQAAVEAFQKAGPFPNPPKGIIEKDGFVRIQWDFILKTEAAPRIQFRGAAGAAN